MDSEPPEDRWRRRIACGLLPLEITPRMGVDTFKYSNMCVIVIITCGVLYVLPCTHLWTVNGIMRSTMIPTSQLQFKMSMEWWTRFHRAELMIVEHSGLVYVSIGRCGSPAWQNHQKTHTTPLSYVSVQQETDTMWQITHWWNTSYAHTYQDSIGWLHFSYWVR